MAARSWTRRRGREPWTTGSRSFATREVRSPWERSPERTSTEYATVPGFQHPPLSPLSSVPSLPGDRRNAAASGDSRRVVLHCAADDLRVLGTGDPPGIGWRVGV